MTLDPAHFRERYDTSPDPYGLADRWYEARKYLVPDAVASARSRNAGLPGVQVEQHVVPGEWPAQSFDLIVFSEIFYYFDDADLDRLLRLGIGALRPGGHLLAVYWRHYAPDHPRAGDEVHEILARDPRLTLAGYRVPDFTAEVYTHSGGDLRSVARADGIV